MSKWLIVPQKTFQTICYYPLSNILSMIFKYKTIKGKQSIVMKNNDKLEHDKPIKLQNYRSRHAQG